MIRLIHIACVLLLLLQSLAHAQTVHNFAYQWEIDGKRTEFSFALSNQDLQAMPSSSAVFSNQIMQREMQVALIKYAQSLDPKVARVEIKKRSQGLEYGVKSRSPEQAQSIMQTLKAKSAEAKKAYLKKHFYTEYVSPTRVSAIKQDHVRYARLSADALTSVVTAIKAQQVNANDAREFVQFALNWIQSIPYDTLENRMSSNGSGFVSPKDLLLQNQGDCDSKATLLAALLLNYNQNIKQKLVLLPKHALLAVALPKRPNEEGLKFDGIEYVFLEAAGPALFDIGEVGDTTLRAIANRQYSIEGI